jgi:Arc/MetJ-type ribon-helix-helix transcriptional regulator
MPTERVTVTMPKEIVEEIDAMTKNRSRFIVDAVRHELERQRREELLVSLRNPHEESLQVADLGMDDWSAGLPDDADLVDPTSGRAVRWRAGEGWSTVDQE